MPLGLPNPNSIPALTQSSGSDRGGTRVGPRQTAGSVRRNRGCRRRAHTRLDIAVYGGSALMLASNFRFATEDVDIAEIGQPWPTWLSEVVERIATRHGWTERWLNDAVTFFLSSHAEPSRDLVFWGTFPRAADGTDRFRTNRAISACAEAQGFARCQIRQRLEGALMD